MPFLRGYIDGDGYVRIKKSKSFILRLSISCGSKIFLERLLKRTNWPQNSIHKDKRANLYNIEWSSIKNNDLIIALYENANIFLDRKYEYYLQLKNAVSNQVDIEI